MPMEFKRLLLVLLWPLACFCTPANAISIGILQFQKSTGVSDAAVKTVEQFVVSKLASERRFEILERAHLGAILAERNVQLGLDESARTQLADLGADFVVFGEVTQVDMNAQTSSGGNRSYKASISFALRILDVSTGRISYTEQFSSTRDLLRSTFAGLTGDVTSESGALDAALRITTKKLDAFIDSAFPVTGKVVSVEKQGRKQDAVEVLISLGPDDGIAKGVKLTAYQRQMVQLDGRDLVRKKPLAELGFLRAEGDNLSVFKVSKGGDELGRLLAAGEVVFVEVRQ